MKTLATWVLLSGLMGSVGCTMFEKQPDGTQAMRTKRNKPVDDAEIPDAVTKLLPADQVDARNAHAQSKLLRDQIDREMSQVNRSATAQRD